MTGKVTIIGGGVAGMSAAATLREMGFSPVIVEKEQRLGGKLAGWHKLFPDFVPASEVIRGLEEKLDGVEILTGSEVAGLDSQGVTLSDGVRIDSDAVIIASGFDVFRAELKEEYGYGIYNKVYTSADIERMLNEGTIGQGGGGDPRRIAILHCVGSRDEKVGQSHCSRICCITGVKQAVELKEAFPESDVYNFYMDIRMFGSGYEEFYRQAQERYNIHFIRGRISEAAETIDGRVQIKAEDTLIGRPMKMTVDMLVLAVGMSPGGSNGSFCECSGVEPHASGFLLPRDGFLSSVESGAENIFYAGTVTAPKNVGESINEGAAAALKAARYLKSRANG